MKKLSFKWAVIFMVLASAVFVAWSCGGGGGGDGGGGTTGSQPLTPATLDQTTAETATSMAMSSGDINDMSGLFLDMLGRASGSEAQASESLAAWSLKQIRESFSAGNIVNTQGDTRAGSDVSPVMDCDYSGTWQISGSWTGPDSPSDICQVSNLKATMTFLNCQDYNESVHGTISLSVSGNACAPTGISIGFSGFSLADGYSGLQFNAAQFDMAMTGLQYSGGEMTHAKVALNGDITADSMNMEFSQYSQDISDNGTMQTISISGSLTGDCLDGWVTFTTQQPIQVYDYADCPFSGSVQISGDSDMMVTFNSDGSMTIGDQDYPSCNSLPDTCQ